MELPSRLLSGPDVAAGFLLQLSETASPDGLVHTYHLQDAGTDAAAEAVASPSELGFAHPGAACMYGGPRCWERSFAGGDADSSAVRFAYNRFRFVLGALLAQRARKAVVPVAEALRELLGRTAAELESRHAAWSIEGSTGAWILGANIAPRAIRIRTEREGGRILEAALSEFRIEPRSRKPPSEPGAGFETSCFVGTFAQGALVSWQEVAPPSGAERPGAQVGPLSVVPWEKWTVPVRAPEFELARLIDHARSAEARAFAPWLRQRGADPTALQSAIRQSTDPRAVGELSKFVLAS